MVRSPESVAPAAGCRIAGHALVECPLSGIAALRGRPVPDGAPPLPPRFLRHADEQTVVGMHAVLEVIARDTRPHERSRHAVIAAPCQSGRLAAAKTLCGLAAGGAVTVSPHVVPQCSLHSIAGAISVALGMHGPHLGVGGGPDALAEGLFAAATLVADLGPGGCPGAWLVATEWDDEPALDAAGECRGDPVCRGLALALEPIVDPGDGGLDAWPLSLAVRSPRRGAGEPSRVAGHGGLVAFARALAMCGEGGALVSWTVTCPWGAEIRISGRPPRAALREAA